MPNKAFLGNPKDPLVRRLELFDLLDRPIRTDVDLAYLSVFRLSPDFENAAVFFPGGIKLHSGEIVSCDFHDVWRNILQVNRGFLPFSGAATTQN